MKLSSVSSIAFAFTSTRKPPPEEVRVVVNKKPTTGHPSYSTEIDPVSGSLTIHSIVPKGIEIQDGLYGKKLVATQKFHEGQVLYVGYAILLDIALSNAEKYFVRLYNHDGTFQTEEIMSTVHSVVDYDKLASDVLHDCIYQDDVAKKKSKRNNSDTSSSPGVFGLGQLPSSPSFPVPSIRQIYGFDAFMNHSCDANTYHPLVSRSSEMMSYQAIAIRDIFPGDEITCDYAFFDYECNGHEIEQCLCGSPKCRGKMMGFQGLSLQEKISILPYCELEIVSTFFRENNDITLLRSEIPPGVDLIVKPNDTHLVATRTFEAAELVFENKSTLIPTHDLSKTYVLECNGKYFLMDNLHHFIHRREYSEAVGFDCFMDHSCCPNTSQVYQDSTTYVVRANHLIQPGDRITMDYTSLDSLERVSFQCNCGSAVCKGLILS
ncbi:hypothetical protein CTEN210_05951 [Chaetoceros tenuissimus]|uniref:Histone-lysine N-methyltransferase n=1 Tax=Chaetoceros tenuissimus TaxID=426638 RepID=A0AAD3H3Y3_9STRA|nr:hypothetical protein CTEN210_05951 [Chaetoceros tenuissimus]